MPAALRIGDSPALRLEFGKDDSGLLVLVLCGVDQHEVWEPPMSLQRRMPASCLAERGARVVYEPSEQSRGFDDGVLQVSFAHAFSDYPTRFIWSCVVSCLVCQPASM